MEQRYSLQDEHGNCLHRESYQIYGSTRRCIEAGDGMRACGFQFESTAEWRRKRKEQIAREGQHAARPIVPARPNVF